MRAFVLCLNAMLLGTAVSCGDGTAPRPVAASLEIVSGDAQEGTVATELPAPLTIRVLDGKGRAKEGQLVTFVVTAGGGAVSAGSDVTNSDGVAEERWTLGKSTSDDQTVEARVVDESGGAALVTEFRATPHAGAPDTVRVVSGDGQSVVVHRAPADSLLARVFDRFGNPVAGAAIAWSVTSGGGALDHYSDVTTATGYTSAKFTAEGVQGDQKVVAAIADRSTTFTVHVTSRPLGELVGMHSLQSLRGASIPTPFFELGNDKFLQVWAGALEILANGTAVLTEDYAFSDVAGTRFEKGVASGVVTMNGDSLNLGINNISGVISTATISVNGGFSYGNTGERIYGGTAMATALPFAGRGTSVATVSGSGQQANAGSTLPQPLVVRVTDGSGAPVAGQTVRFWVVAGNGTLSDGTTNREDVITDAAGLAQVRWTLGTTTPLFVRNATEDQAVLAMIISTVEGLPAPRASFSAVSVNP